jgi:hypothetical protein
MNFPLVSMDRCCKEAPDENFYRLRLGMLRLATERSSAAPGRNRRFERSVLHLFDPFPDYVLDVNSFLLDLKSYRNAFASTIPRLSDLRRPKTVGRNQDPSLGFDGLHSVDGLHSIDGSGQVLLSWAKSIHASVL